jgi:hypothetical protein
MDIQLHDLHQGDHFWRQLLLKERDHDRFSGQDDVTYLVFADTLHQAFNHFFGVLLVCVSDTPLVAGLRPSTDLGSMNFLAFHLFRIYYPTKPKHEDACRVGMCKHRGVPRVLLIEAG